MTVYFDDFNRPNTARGSGLGVIPGGPAWSSISGDWQIFENEARANTFRGDNPISAVDINESNASVQLDVSQNGGDAVYGRIVDANNWWRLGTRSWQTEDTETVTEYEWRANYSGSGTAIGYYSWTHSHSENYLTAWSTSNTTCPHPQHDSHSHTIPQSSNITNTWNAISADSWRTSSSGGGSGGWRGDNLAYQGQFENFGLHKGLWFFPSSDIRSTLANRVLTSVRLRITRRSSSHGVHSEGIPTMRLHNYASRPSGEPTMGSANSGHGVGFALGDTKWVPLSNTWGNALRDNTAKGLGVYTTSNDPYLQFTSSAILETISYWPSTTSDLHSHGRDECTLTGNTRTVEGSSSTTTHYSASLQRCVNGTITTMATSSGPTTRVRIEFDDNQVRAYRGTSTTPFYTRNDSTHSSSTKFGLGRRESELGGYSSLDNFRLQLLNQAPFAPSLNSPSDGDILNANSNNTFKWTHNDPDNDSQSYFVLEYGIVGQSSVTAISKETPTTSWTAPAGTFSADNYRWRVKTTDDGGLEGPFSDWRYFTGAIPPDQATITSPSNNSTITEAEIPVEWSATEQDRYQLRVVHDKGGDPDTSQIYYDTGEVLSTSRSVSDVPFPTNEVFRHIQVRVERQGLWSTWASIRVEVSYIPPREAILTLDPLESVGGIRVIVTNPTPLVDEPTVVENTIERREVNTNWAPITTMGANAVFTDYLTESGTEYDYRVVSLGDNSTTRESQAYSARVRYNKWFLKDPERQDSMELFVDGQGDMDIEQKEDQAEFNPLGRRDRLIIRDKIRGDRFSITIQLMGREEREQFIGLRERQKVLLLQSPFQQWYINFGRDGIRSIKNVTDDYEHYSVECIEQRDPFNV